MRLLSARLIISLIVGITVVSLCTSYYQVLMQSRSMRKDLERRAEVLGESLARNVERDLERDAQTRLQRTVQQFANREHLAGLAVYDPQGHPTAVTPTLEPRLESDGYGKALSSIDSQSGQIDRRSTRLNSRHLGTPYAVCCLRRKNT